MVSIRVLGLFMWLGCLMNVAGDEGVQESGLPRRKMVNTYALAAVAKHMFHHPDTSQMETATAMKMITKSPKSAKAVKMCKEWVPKSLKSDKSAKSPKSAEYETSSKSAKSTKSLKSTKASSKTSRVSKSSKSQRFLKSNTGVIYCSEEPSMSPSHILNTLVPTVAQSSEPSESPSQIPSTGPSESPSMNPSDKPTMEPSLLPSSSPSKTQSQLPSMEPSDAPSMLPSHTPSMIPSQDPTVSQSPSDAPVSTAAFEASKTMKNIDTPKGSMKSSASAKMYKSFFVLATILCLSVYAFL